MIREINNKEDWNNFVLGTDPNSFLESWQWGQVQLQTDEQIKYLGVFSDSEQIGGALVIKVNAKRGHHYLIPHGPISKDETYIAEVLGEIVSYLRKLTKNDRVCGLRVAPQLESNAVNLKIFQQLGFKPAPLHVHAELTWMLDIDKEDDQLLAEMRKTTRHAIRKAQNSGVVTEIVNDAGETLNRFWPLYEQTRERHGFVLWPKQMIEEQLKIFAQDGLIFSVFARYDDRDVAVAILPQFGQVTFYYHGASLKLSSSLPAAQLVQWAAIQEAKRKGSKRYNFWGISRSYQKKNAGDSRPHPFDGITTFKTGFGGYAINYMHAQDLPLSLGYWKLWAVDNYRKLRRGF